MRTTLLVALSTCVLSSGCVSRGATAGVDALRTVVAQNIHLGDSPNQVIQFLDDQHLEHSKLFRSTKPETAVSINGHKYDGQLIIVAIKRNTAETTSGSESIQIVFVFSDETKLIRYDLIPMYTSF
jgi:hypothetical protein